MVGQRILVPSAGVRLSPSQPFSVLHSIWPVRLAVWDAALSRRRSPVRIWYGLPNVQGQSFGSDLIVLTQMQTYAVLKDSISEDGSFLELGENLTCGFMVAQVDT